MNDKLRPAEQLEFMERIAELASNNVPLVEGLRATSEEAGSNRLGRTLRRLADDLSEGKSWEESLRPGKLPPHAIGLIAAGLETDSLGLVLSDLVEHRRMRRDLWYGLVTSLAYPVVVLIASIAVVLLLAVALASPVVELYEEFGRTPPTIVQQWLWATDEGVENLWIMGLSLIGVMMAIRIFGGRILCERILGHIPLMGKMVVWSGIAEFAWLLRSMLAQDIPMPQALALTSGAVSSPNVSQLAAWLSKGVEAGVPLSTLLLSTTRVPAALVPIVQWGEQSGSMMEAWDSIYQMVNHWLQFRTSLLSSILVPLIFVGVGAMIVSLLAVFVVPTVDTMQWFM